MLCTRPVQNVSSYVIWKIEAFIEEDKDELYRGQWHLSPLQSWHLGTSHSSPNRHQLPCCVFLKFQEIEISISVWNFFPFKVILVLGKPRSLMVPSLGWAVLSPGWFDVSPKNSARDVLHEWARCDKAANHQLPRAAAFWIIPGVSMEGCSSLMQNLVQIRCSAGSVILNVTATQYTCSLNGVCYPPD